MLDIPDPSLVPHVEPVGNPSATPGEISIPFHVERFDDSSHIAPSTLVVVIPSHTSQT